MAEKTESSFETTSNAMETKMFVNKRDGRQEPVHFDKIISRIDRLAQIEPVLDAVDPTIVAQKVISGIYKGVSTRELDELAGETCAYMSTKHPQYDTLAARIAVSNLQKETPVSFYEKMKMLYKYTTPKNSQPNPLISNDLWRVVANNKEAIEKEIDYSRDFSFDYFGFKTLLRSYLLRIDGKPIERPQDLYMRVALGIHCVDPIDDPRVGKSSREVDLKGAFETYHLLSQKYMTHASPTLFNAGTPFGQLSSCFLLTMKEDSIEGIYDTLKQCALISKRAGGIGLEITGIRSTGTYIKGTNGVSSGIVPMLKVFNDTARYVDQAGRRKGSFCVYIQPHHPDIFEFLDLRKNTGKDEHRARDLFYALWIPDLFMERVEANGTWSLFSEDEAPGLQDAVGDDYRQLYETYEKTHARKTIDARELWDAIITSQIETGGPFMLYKDSANQKSNQKNLGTIRSSNLCTEVVIYTSSEECGVCNLASISLPRYVSMRDGVPWFDHDKLREVVKVITRNLNKVIDKTYYPIPEARYSNLKNRPIGIGVSGLADAFIKMRYPFESEEAQKLNADIFETIYYSALETSSELAEADGAYESIAGSPIAEGILQPDLWERYAKNHKDYPRANFSGRWDWDALRDRVRKHGVRNSLLLSPMPTASTSQILGTNESFEPYTSNIYTRRVLSGEFVVINHHLVDDLIERGVWGETLKNKIVANNGSVLGISDIPSDLQELYKTAWEISQRVRINMASRMATFVDQSASLNIFMPNPTYQKLTSMHFHGWRCGLKTGMYYLRSRPAVDAIKYTVAPKEQKKKVVECNDEEGCLMCSG